MQEAFRRGRRARIARFGGMSLAAVASVTAIALVAANLTTPERERIAPAPGVQEGRITFSRSGEGGGIMTMNANGSDVAQIATTDFSVLSEPRWSPDGAKIAFHGFYGSAANEAGGLFVMNADGTDRRLIALGGDMPTWSPDGSNIAFYKGGTLLIVSLSGDEQNAFIAVEGEFPDWSPDGQRIAFTRRDLYVVNVDGGRPQRLNEPSWAAVPAHPRWSPDGTRIAFTEYTDEVINGVPQSGVRIVDAEGGATRMLVQGANPTWSPDGTRIAFERIEGTNTSHIYSINVDGTDEQQLTVGDVADHSPDWTSEAPSDQRASTTHRNDELGLAITTPAEWTTQWSASPQSTALYGATFAFDRSNGFCSKQGPLTTLPPDGAFFWMYEFDLPDAPLRPESFSIDEQSFASYEGSGCVGTYRINFSDSDRTFSIHVAFGPEAGAALRDELITALDSLEVQSGASEDPPPEITAEAEIYAAVVRRLVTKDHTFGGAASPFKHVYIVDGSIPDAGNPHKDTLRPASERFTDELKMEIEEQLRDLPPLEFIVDPSDVRRGEQGMDGVENDGVIITLGPIERKGTEVRVSNGLWCSGRCGQWLTYVLEERGGVWKVTGTTGPSAIS